MKMHATVPFLRLLDTALLYFTMHTGTEEIDWSTCTYCSESLLQPCFRSFTTSTACMI
eukprot:COSAG06_NODE_39088_length_416_cov_1.274448_2_plen_57_part_01